MVSLTSAMVPCRPMAGGGGDPVKVIKAALYANGAIAIVKFIAAYLSSSSATLAEAVHSVADTGNQALLLVGVRLALKNDDPRFPFGRAAERYFWPFIVAILLFSVGGLFALYEGIHKAIHPDTPDLSNFWSFKSPLPSLVVLAVSTVFETISCKVALVEFRKFAGDKPLRQALFDSKDPTIPLVLLEDFAALTGLVLAFLAVGVSALTGNGLPDAIGSIVIGLLLMVVAVIIAKDAHSLIIGERATPEMERKVQELTESTEGVVGITQLLTLHLGPDMIVLAMKVAFKPEATVPEVEKVTDAVEARIRAAIPEMKKIFIEPDSDGDLIGVIRAEARAAPS